jgi:aryl-alcohol dehydrogenase-like predicted oxidoreductase
MGLNWAYAGGGDASEAEATLIDAVDAGVTLFDTAEVYGPFENEKLVGRVLGGARRDRVLIATKFGFRIEGGGMARGVDSRPAHIREVVDASLKRLATDRIDLLYQHRVDPSVPIEDVVGTMGEFVRAGKVRYLGLSEASAATLQRAHAVHPISALQSEYSLWERGIEKEILPTARALGIGVVPYSPLGRGFLTGASSAPRTSRPTTFAATSPACRARTSITTWSWSRNCAAWPTGSVPPRRRSPWPGCSPRDPTSCRSSAPRGATDCARTWAPRASSSRRATSSCSTDVRARAGRGRAIQRRGASRCSTDRGR